MALITPSNIEKVVEQTRKSINYYRTENDPVLKKNALNNFFFYLQAKLGDKYGDFLRFAFPAYAERNYVPAGLIICTDNLPELLRDFLTQSQTTSPD